MIQKPPIIAEFTGVNNLSQIEDLFGNKYLDGNFIDIDEGLGLNMPKWKIQEITYPMSLINQAWRVPNLMNQLGLIIVGVERKDWTIAKKSFQIFRIARRLTKEDEGIQKLWWRQLQSINQVMKIEKIFLAGGVINSPGFQQYYNSAADIFCLAIPNILKQNDIETFQFMPQEDTQNTTISGDDKNIIVIQKRLKGYARMDAHC